MPASNIGSYLQNARNSFDAVRPAPIYADASQSIGQCQNVHISTNCYYGYHDLKKPENNHVDTDCEMVELEFPDGTPSKTTSRKRSADEEEYPQRKRLREGKIRGRQFDTMFYYSKINVNILITHEDNSEHGLNTNNKQEPEVQREKNIEPETNETVKLDTSTEDVMESLYWNIHGGNIFHLIQCL